MMKRKNKIFSECFFNKKKKAKNLKRDDKVQYAFNVFGGQVNIANDSGEIYATAYDYNTNKVKHKVKRKILLVCSVLSSLFILLIPYINNAIKYQRVSSKVNQIKLSMDDDYINDLFGNPISIINHSESNITECLYKLEGVVIRVFYKGGYTFAYFITLTEKNNFLNIETDNLFYPDVKFLGDFTYYDTLEVPTYILGYCQNGTGHILYSEFYAGYQLRTHALMYMEYGTDLDYFIIPGEIIYDDKVTEDYAPFSNLLWLDGVDELAKYTRLNMEVDRKIACPNTFGVISYFDLDIINYITNYNYYDYSLLNNL